MTHNPIAKPSGEYNVVQFFPDGIHEYVREHVSVEEALSAAQHYTQNVSAYLKLTRRVIITDSDDSIVFEWVFGQGVVWPDNAVDPQRRDYGK